MNPEIMSPVAVFIAGSMVGSFLNVCIFRLPKDQSIAFPASHCQSCHGAIVWYDNIPIVSFLLLNGKCRHCQSKISWQYPIIESLTAVMFLIFYQKFGLTPRGYLYLYLGLLLQVRLALLALLMVYL